MDIDRQRKLNELADRAAQEFDVPARVVRELGGELLAILQGHAREHVDGVVITPELRVFVVQHPNAHALASALAAVDAEGDSPYARSIEFWSRAVAKAACLELELECEVSMACVCAILQDHVTLYGEAFLGGAR